MWLKVKQAGQTVGFGLCFHLPGFHLGTGCLSSHLDLFLFSFDFLPTRTSRPQAFVGVTKPWTRGPRQNWTLSIDEWDRVLAFCQEQDACLGKAQRCVRSPSDVIFGGPVVPYSPFWGEGSCTKIGYRKDIKYPYSNLSTGPNQKAQLLRQWTQSFPVLKLGRAF